MQMVFELAHASQLLNAETTLGQLKVNVQLRKYEIVNKQS